MATTLTFLSPASQKVCLDAVEITRFADALLEETGKKEYALSVVFVDDNKIRQMNRDYRNKDAPTNVLSFPFSDGAEPFLQDLPVHDLGDIIISIDTARRESVEYGEDFSYRLCWLIVHGLLHLCGLDHERSTEEAQQMAAREKELLERHYRMPDMS